MKLDVIVCPVCDRETLTRNKAVKAVFDCTECGYYFRDERYQAHAIEEDVSLFDEDEEVEDYECTHGTPFGESCTECRVRWDEIQRNIQPAQPTPQSERYLYVDNDTSGTISSSRYDFTLTSTEDLLDI